MITFKVWHYITNLCSGLSVNYTELDEFNNVELIYYKKGQSLLRLGQELQSEATLSRSGASIITREGKKSFFFSKILCFSILE